MADPRSSGKARVSHKGKEPAVPELRTRSIKISRALSDSVRALEGTPRLRDLDKLRRELVGHWTCDFFQTGDRRVEWKALFDSFPVKTGTRPPTPKTIQKRYGIDPRRVQIAEANESIIAGTIVSLGQLDCGLRFPLPPFMCRLLSVSGLCPGQLSGNAIRIIYFFIRVESDHQRELRRCYRSIPKKEHARVELGYFFYHYRWVKSTGIFYTLVGNPSQCRPVEALEQSDKEYDLWPLSVSGEWCTAIKVPDAPQSNISDLVKQYQKGGKFFYTPEDTLPFDKLFFSLTKNTRMWKQFRYCPIQTTSSGRFEKGTSRLPGNTVIYSDYEKNFGSRPAGEEVYYDNGTICRFLEAPRFTYPIDPKPQKKKRRSKEREALRNLGALAPDLSDDDDEETQSERDTDTVAHSAAGAAREGVDAGIQKKRPFASDYDSDANADGGGEEDATRTKADWNKILKKKPLHKRAKVTKPPTTVTDAVPVSMQPPSSDDPDLAAALAEADFEINLSETAVEGPTGGQEFTSFPEGPVFPKEPRVVVSENSEAASKEGSGDSEHSQGRQSSLPPAHTSQQSYLTLDPNWSTAGELEPVLQGIIGLRSTPDPLFDDRLGHVLGCTVDIIRARVSKEWEDRLRQAERDVDEISKTLASREARMVLLSTENGKLKVKMQEMEKDADERSRLEALCKEKDERLQALESEVAQQKEVITKMDSDRQTFLAESTAALKDIAMEKAQLGAKVDSLSRQVVIYKEATQKAKDKMFEAVDRLKKQRAVANDLQAQLNAIKGTSDPISLKLSIPVRTSISEERRMASAVEESKLASGAKDAIEGATVTNPTVEADTAKASEEVATQVETLEEAVVEAGDRTETRVGGGDGAEGQQP